MTTAGIALWSFCAVLAVIGAILTVTARRPLRSAMALLMHIIALAGIYLTQRAELLAALQLIVYAGAVVVLFVFVIMVIGPATQVVSSERRTFTTTLAIALGVTLAMPLIAAWSALSMPVAPLDESFGGVESVGLALYQDAWLPFELVSITLLVAILGALVIATAKKGEKS